MFELYRIVAARLSNDHFARLVTDAWLPSLPVRASSLLYSELPAYLCSIIHLVSPGRNSTFDRGL